MTADIGPSLDPDQAVDNLRIGSMFSGVGGLDLAVLALLPGSSIAWHCENDDASSRVLDVRFPDVPNLRDVTATDWTSVEPVDVVCGGFPCQDISHAGKRAGIKEGNRSGLWFDMLDAVRVLRPRLLLLENVAAITAADGGLDVVLGSLAEAGWDAEWTLLRASDVGAPHRRDRWFCVAYPSGELGTVEPTVDGREPAVVSAGARAGRGDHAGHPAAGVQILGRGAGQEQEGAADADGSGSQGPVVGEPGGRPLTAERAAADAGRDGLLRGQEQDLGPHGPGQQAPLGDDADGLAVGDHGEGWGDYEPAILRWEQVIGRPAPAPVDDKGRLSPDFVEWMMGWPAGWTDVPGSSRTSRLKQCGNGVVTHQAYAAYLHLLAAVDNARRQTAA